MTTPRQQKRVKRQPKNTLTTQTSLPNVNAYTTVQLGLAPFLADDIFAEPTKRFLDQSVIEYIPFQTYDLWALDRIQAICNNSSTTASIIQQKVSYFMGDGYYSVAAATMDPLPSIRKQKIQEQQIDIVDELTLNNFLKQINAEG